MTEMIERVKDAKSRWRVGLWDPLFPSVSIFYVEVEAAGEEEAKLIAAGQNRPHYGFSALPVKPTP